MQGLELNVLQIKDVTEKVRRPCRRGPTPAEAFKPRHGEDRRDREGRGRPGEEHPGRRRHALRRRAVPPVHVQEVHRHPPGLRPGAADRLLRRRPGQLRVPAVRPRHLLLPRLRERQAGQARALPEVEPGRHQGRTSWSSSPATPAGRTGRTPWPSWSTCATPATRTCSTGSTGGRCCSASWSGAERGERAAGRGGALRHPEQPQGPRSAGWRGCSTRTVWAARGRGEAAPASSSTQGRSVSRGEPAAEAFSTRSRRPRRSRAELIKDMTLLENGGRVQHPPVRHRPHPAAGRRRSAQAVRRAAPRVRRRPADSLKFQLFSDEPIYDDLETLKLADALTFLAATLGAGRRPGEEGAGRQVAARAGLRAGQRDEGEGLEVRKKLFEGGKAAVDAAKDPMIELARLVDADGPGGPQEVRERGRGAEAAGLRGARQGPVRDGRDKTYPDATFTLRLAFGTVKGYSEDGKPVPPFTTFAGPVQAAARAGQQAAVRPAAALGGAEGQARPEDAVQLRLHGRHHRRQLGQPGHQPERRGGRADLRRQHPVAGAGLHLRRGDGPGGVGRQPGIVEALRKVYDANELADELTGKGK